MPKPKLLLPAMVKRLDLEPVALDSAFAAMNGVTKLSDVRKLNPRDIAEWYLFGSGVMIVKIHREWVDPRVWPLVVPTEEERKAQREAATGMARFQGSYHLNVADKIANILPDWLGFLCPQAGNMLTEVELVKGVVVQQGEQPFAGSFNTKSYMDRFRYKHHWYYVDGKFTDCVQRFWPEARVFIGPTLYGEGLWGENITRSCPLVWLCGEEEADGEAFRGDCVAVVMPLDTRRG